MLGPYRFMYEKQLRLDAISTGDVIANQLFMQQYTVTVSVFTPSVTAT